MADKARNQPTTARRRVQKSITSFPIELDRLVHERIRLGILSALAATDSFSFTDLRDLLSTTDGNLSVHARRLEDAGYISCTKSFEQRTPRTTYEITSTGRRALESYLGQMESIIRMSKPG
jgi:DNA-binding MarR family transcriptional regulator